MFYLAFIHCEEILRNNFGYMIEQVIYQNFFVSIVEMLGILSLIYLCYYVYPLMILKIRMVIFWVLILICPYLLSHARTAFDIFLFQVFILLFLPSLAPARSILFTYFAVFQRCTYVSSLFAISHTIMYIITSFGLIYLTKYLGNYGLLIIIIPVMIGYSFGIFHFEKLEKRTGNYPKKKNGFS